MRAGPSTGIPTKSEQADLDLALYGLHGDAPHLVLGPLDAGDCAFTFDWAVRLAERLQTPAIVLSDQFIGQSRAIVDPAPRMPGIAERRLPDADGGEASERYDRYALTAESVSPMALPGTPGHSYTADGLEHDPHAVPSSRTADHRAQLDKRTNKLRAHDFGAHWAAIEGDGTICLLTWGSSRGAVAEAARRLRAGGRRTRVIALRLLAPLQTQALVQAIEKRRVLVVELSHSAQLFRYLHAQRVLPESARSLARAGPVPLRPAEIIAALDP
jgi:2-oxoglutarate ferredoxin oxidoreductase subunit alpha